MECSPRGNPGAFFIYLKDTEVAGVSIVTHANYRRWRRFCRVPGAAAGGGVQVLGRLPEGLGVAYGRGTGLNAARRGQGRVTAEQAIGRHTGKACRRNEG
jgi:hypothetical protein